MKLPRIALLVIGDGRTSLHAATIRSWHARAREYDLTRLHTVDDSLHLLGFCGAVRYGWERLREDGPPFDYVFHLEEDWIFNRVFSVAHMTRVLDTEPQVAQVALRRGAEPQELPVVERWAEDFTDRATENRTRSQAWLEHRLFFTTNPSVYRRQLVEAYEWPEPPRCEAAFTETLVTEGATFAYWGDRCDEPWITHTGTRTGHGY